MYVSLGTSSIVDEHSHEPILSILSLVVETAVKLRKDGYRVVIVSSGAVGMGMRRLDIEKRPKDLPSIQASDLDCHRGKYKVIDVAGIGSCWTVQVDQSMG